MTVARQFTSPRWRKMPIKAMISDPARVPDLHEDPELLAISERLPALQAELAALRAAAAPPDEP